MFGQDGEDQKDERRGNKNPYSSNRFFHPAFILSKWIFRISILKLKFKFRLAPERIHQVSGER